MVYKYSEFLTRTIDGAGYWIKQLINERNYACEPGARGREHTKSNFLIMREIKDYQFAFLSPASQGRYRPSEGAKDGRS